MKKINVITFDQEGNASIDASQFLENPASGLANLSTALLVINSYWENNTMDGIIGGIAINNQIICNIPADRKDFVTTLDLIPYLTAPVNILSIAYVNIDLHVWKNTATMALILDGHNAESYFFSAEGEHQKVHQISKPINR